MRVLILALLSLASVSAQSCSGANSHYCGTSGGSADQPAIPAESGCCCNWGFEVVTGTADCQKATASASASCGAFAYQCGSGDERELSGCSGCCCNYGYAESSGCDCALASASPAPSGDTAANTCGMNTYQCGTGDEREHPDCGGCCCLYGYESTASTCECAAASKSPAPSGAGNTCGINTYQCGSGDDREHPDCGGCCCIYGYESTAGTCECAAASKSPAPSGNTAGNTCGAGTYQCGSGDDREHPDCGGCCCLYGYESTASTCECAAASKSPAPSAGADNTCSTNTYQCGSGDDREHPDCGGCCCFYGTEAVGSTCTCAYPSKSPAPSSGALIAGECSTNAYQCSTDEDRAHPDCGGCCCNYGTEPVTGSCECAAPSPSPGSSFAAGECGPFSYQCSAEDSNAHSSCSGCCCNYGYEEVDGTCGCAAASKSPSPSAGAPDGTCGTNSYQCSLNEDRAHPDCGGCCCNYNHDPESGTCNCIAPSPEPAGQDPTSNSCGTNAFDCAGVGSSNQPALTGANCDQCCCFWGMTQDAGTCNCQA